MINIFQKFIYLFLGCDGFPEQTITCYVHCSKKSTETNIEKSSTFLSSNNKILIEKKLEMLNNKNNDETNEEFAVKSKWNDWSSWSMICDVDCTRSRHRECMAKEVKYCVGLSTEVDKCPYYCEPSKNEISLIS
jgi:hypothetical protein